MTSSGRPPMPSACSSPTASGWKGGGGISPAGGAPLATPPPGLGTRRRPDRALSSPARPPPNLKGRLFLIPPWARANLGALQGGSGMKCPRCQHENPASLKFCGECGARLASVCSACGASNAPVQKFCGECGAALTPGAPAAKFASPESYTPKHLAEKILTSKGALEGERKQVTVLFADLKGSMELLAEQDPEEARELLDPVLERMMEAVHPYEGTVTQVMGEGIMALFGAPLACEDHAIRACSAALRMQETVKRYADSVRRAEGLPLQIRVGLNSGEVVVRSIGSDLHMDYTAVGQTTPVAARMEQMAWPASHPWSTPLNWRRTTIV